MSAKAKPIQPTPILKGVDAQKIIVEVQRIPSVRAVNRNKDRLQILNRIEVK